MSRYHKLDDIEWNSFAAAMRQARPRGRGPPSLASLNRPFSGGAARSSGRGRSRHLGHLQPKAVAQGLCAATAAVERDAGVHQDQGSAVSLCPAGGAPETAVPDASAASAEHLATPRRLQRRIHELLSGDYLGASADRQPQAVKDLATALERLQRAEAPRAGPRHSHPGTRHGTRDRHPRQAQSRGMGGTYGPPLGAGPAAAGRDGLTPPHVAAYGGGWETRLLLENARRAARTNPTPSESRWCRRAAARPYTPRGVGVFLGPPAQRYMLPRPNF